MISIEDLKFNYKKEKIILNNINLKIQEGKVVSIIGKNGSGKSTLIKLIAGLLKPTEGQVLIDGINACDKDKFYEIRKKVGIVFQNPDNQILFPRVYDDIEFAMKNLKLNDRDSKIKDALKNVEMLDYIDSDTYELSLGQKQRINIASVLAVNSKYILLDEPTTMIDSKGKEAIYKIIRNMKKEGYTIIFITNNINEILLSDDILILENGNIKHQFEKKNILENINLLEECDIKIPDIIKIILKLKDMNVDIILKDWTIEEMIEEIVKVYKK